MCADISVTDLNFRYSENTPYVLKNISLAVNKGEWLTILGHNGSGKSTLAKFFNALYVPQEGDVTVFGMNTKKEEKRLSVRRRVAMVFQNPDNQIVAPTVEDDVAFGLENAGIPYGAMRERVYGSIRRLGLEGLEQQEPHKLSGGQKQRVALAGALALRPDVIVLDEATSMLDPEGRQEVLGMVEKLRQEDGLTIINITHDVNEAVLADRIVILNEGNIIHQGAPADIFTNEAVLQEAGLRAPFIVQAAKELRESGIDIKPDVLSREELVEALCAYRQKM